MKLALALFMATLAAITETQLRQSDDDSKDESDEASNSKEDNDEDQDPQSVSLELPGFDLRGTIKRSFALTAALEKPERNLVCSPISALLPIGKLVLGTKRGKSREELLTGIGALQNQVKRRFRKLLYILQNLKSVALSVASRLFVSKDVTISPKFQKLTFTVFKSSCEKLDFLSPSVSAGRVNNWVKEKTRGMIPQILSPEDINPGVSLIVVNAIYFGGLWKQPFDKLAMATFHSPRGDRQQVMMSRTGTYNYARSKTLGSEIIEIPYADKSATFVIVLPERKSSLTLVLQQLKLAPELLITAMADLEPMRVNLVVPKFRIETELNLGRLYKKLGISRIFSSKDSGLTNIIRKRTVQVSKAIQKCVIEVNEKGTEAGAASGIEVEPVSQHSSLKVNRPFLFFVRIRNEQLFAGIYNTPPNKIP